MKILKGAEERSGPIQMFATVLSTKFDFEYDNAEILSRVLSIQFTRTGMIFNCLLLGDIVEKMKSEKS